MKIIGIAILVLAMWSLSLGQGHDKQGSAKAETSKTSKVTGKISEDGKSFISDSDSKSWTISNPDAVKGHEGHHVTLNAHVNADKSEVRVMSMKTKRDKCPCGEGGSEGETCPPCPNK